MSNRLYQIGGLVAALLLLVIVQAISVRDSEPYFNNDETRHLMTGVFVRDALADGGWREPRAYANRYYLQYPALGLLAWPPLFYGIEGLGMAVLGTSFAVGKLTVAVFAAVACLYLYRLMLLLGRSIHVAALATTLLGLTPIVFRFSQQVMLEVPTLAWAMMAIFYFERYLGEGRRRDAVATGLIAAFAALTRFDAVFLLPYFAVRILMLRRWRELTRLAVLGGVGMAVILTAPYYALTWKMYGGTLQKAAGEGTNPDSVTFRAERNLPFYPMGIPRQVGIPITVAAVVGLAGALRCRRPTGIALSIMLATYVTFTPMAELEDRHAIYWIPALCMFAADALEWCRTGWLRCAGVAGAIGLVILVAVPRLDRQPPVVHGYADAAQEVLDHRGPADVVFFDGVLSGGFVYQMRHLDPSRSATVLRGDKLVYGVLSDPSAGYREWAGNSTEVLALLHRYDPDWIVIEAPQAFFPDLPAPKLLRKTLMEHPDRYEHVARFDVPLRTDHPGFAGVVLELYRPKVRNPNRESIREIPMLNLREPVRSPAQ